jgi:microcystin-dependent protein
MSIITTILGSDRVKDSRAVINDNFAALNNDKVETLADLGVTASASDLNNAVLSKVPTGAVFAWIALVAPTGWLLCDGTAVSRTTYADLFALTGTTYGAGDGATTFNVPDLRARFPLGYSSSAPTKVLTFASRSSNTITVTGADNHAHNENQTGQAVLYSAPSGAMTGLTHNTTYYLIRVTATTFQLATSVANANAGTAITLSSNGTGAQTFTITYTARPLGQTGGEETHALTDAEMPSHIHGLPMSNGAAGSSINAATESTTASRSTNAAGSDAPHNNMPLFTVINYIIKT